LQLLLNRTRVEGQSLFKFARGVVAMLRAAIATAATAVAACSRSGDCMRDVDASTLLQLRPLADAPPRCPDRPSSYGGSTALDVAWAADFHQLPGLKASVASAIRAVQGPLRAHIMVQRPAMPYFQKLFGMRPGCRSVEAFVGRAIVILHPFDSDLVGKSIPRMTPAMVKARGKLDSPEQAVRLYMHKLLDCKVVIWLDSDTIVKQDLTPLYSRFVKSGQTIAFASREKPLRMMMNESNPCHFEPDVWGRLMDAPVYNSGVYIVDLEQWAHKRLSERIERYVSDHNACDGKLWKAADQVPLVLAFVLPVLRGQAPEYSVFGAEWNLDEMRCETSLQPARLQLASVLHWAGPHKPWNADGCHQKLWRPYFQYFSRCFPLGR